MTQPFLYTFPGFAVEEIEPQSSDRATALPIADDDTPSCRPAIVQLRASAA